MAKSNRTLEKLLVEFMPLHEEGHTIPEIAKTTGIDASAIYNNLAKLAEYYGVTRESLLSVPHPNYSKERASCTKTGVHQLSAKMLRELIKRGFTFDDFCQRYYCNRSDLEARIRTLLRNDKTANEAINEIVFNTKKKSNKGKTEKSAKESPEIVEQPVDESQLTDEAKPLSDEERLKVLNQQKQNLLEQSKEAASRYADADRGYGKCCNRLSELEGQINELKARLLSCEAEKAETLKKQAEFFEARQSAKKERDAIAAEITNVDQEISKLTTVQLFAYEDGRIEAINAPDFVINKEGADKYFDLLSHDPRLNNFLVKEVKLLACAMAIRKNAEGVRQIAVTFDNEGLGDIFTST